MARLHVQFASKQLEKTTDLYIVKPDSFHPKKPLRTLFLLHGYTGNYSDWLFYTNVEKYITTMNMILVMPSAYNGFYTNTNYGINHFNYIADELPAFIESLFNISLDSENTFIAGLSMGGYGALKVALSRPFRFSKAASFSGVLDVASIREDDTIGKRKLFVNTFDNPIKDQDNLFRLAEQALNQVDLYISCGTEDFLFNHNQNFHNHLKEIGYNHIYITRPGNHTWEFWDEEIKKALQFFIE